MKVLLALMLALPLQVFAARLVNLDFGTPLVAGRLEITLAPNGDLASLSSVLRKGFNNKTKTRTLAQLLAVGGHFPITSSGDEIGRLTLAPGFSATTGGTVHFAVSTCSGSRQSHRLSMRLNVARQWRLFNGNTEIRTVDINGPIVTQKCLENLGFR